MQLKGYIKAIKENCFTIPIYGDGNHFYTHVLLDNFRLKEFCKIDLNESDFFKLYLSKNFKIGDIGAIVFVGKDNYILYGSANQYIEEVINYLNDTTDSSTFFYIKQEAIELRGIINLQEEVRENLILESNGNIKILEIKDDVQIADIDVSIDNVVKYSLEEYFEAENYLTKRTHNEKIKEDIIKKYIESALLNSELHLNRLILSDLLIKYLNEDKSAFEEIIFNTQIGKNFTTFMSLHNNIMIYPLHGSIENDLKNRAHDRREKLKQFNYQFHHNDSYLNEFERIPAYKRAGIDLTETPHSSSKLSHVVISMETRDLKNINELKSFEDLVKASANNL